MKTALRGFAGVARGLLAALLCCTGLSAAAGELASHRAVYDLELADAESSADLAGLSGRMVLEWSGTSCEGYTLNQRLVTQLSDTDGGQMVRDLRMTSWESGDGDQFRFEVQRYVDNNLEESVSGFAERGPDGALATFSEPSDVQLVLPSSIVFPSEFVRGLIAAAEKGEILYTVPVFEGAETDTYFDVSAFVGRPSRVETDAAKIDGEGADISAGPSWPVQVSYFLPDAKDGVPDYQISYRLFTNGVSSNMKLDYGDVIINGRLSALTYLAQDPC